MEAAELRSELAAVQARHAQLEVYSGEAMQALQQEIAGLQQQLAAQQDGTWGEEDPGAALQRENTRLQVWFRCSCVLFL